jgi:glycosyltransferase involved in cell wall biosynthesis
MDSSAAKYLTVCIPTYEMGGRGHVFLRQSLEVLTAQNFRDFDVVVSDYSKNDLIAKLCSEYASRLAIRYFKNTDPTGGMAANTNNAIRHATGRLIKILLQDDYLASPAALQTIVEKFDLAKDTWLVTACDHVQDGEPIYQTHYPKYTKKIFLGKNTIGSPSVLTIKNDHPLLFDTQLKWLVDCDYYRRYHDLAGDPKIVKEAGVVIQVGDHQITNTEATTALREKEYQYMLVKFKDTPPRNPPFFGLFRKRSSSRR